jgi:hypothetical protein
MAITDAKTDSEPVEDALTTAGHLQGLYDQSRSNLSNRHEMWRKAYQLVHNRALASKDRHVPPVSASEVYPILAALVGWMTDQPIEFEATPVTDPHSPYSEWMQDVAHDLETLLHGVWVQHDFYASVERMLWDAMIYGTGFLKTTWDPSLDEGIGNVEISRCDPFSIYPDPSASNLDEANYIIEARDLSYQEIERRFPDKIDEVIARAEVNQSLSRRDDPLDPGGRKPMANPGGVEGGKPIYGLPGQSRLSTDREIMDGSVTVLECWIKENVLHMEEVSPNDPGAEPVEVYVPEWRVIIIAGPVVLFNASASDLWNHGRHPYVRFQAHDLGDMWGISLVDHLAPCQLAVNRLLSALQHHAELVGNPVFMEAANSGIARTKIVNKAGQRIIKNPGSEAGWMTPPGMEPGVQDLVQFWINEMERISGLSAIVRGATPTGRNAQGVIDSVQESAFVRVRLSLRNLERSLSKVGELASNLIVENFTLPRTVAIAGPDGEKTMLALRGRHFFSPTSQGAEPMRFSISIRAGAAHPISRSARAQEADTMYGMGALDDQALLEAHDYPNRKQILERLNALKGMGIDIGPGKRKRQR